MKKIEFFELYREAGIKLLMWENQKFSMLLILLKLILVLPYMYAILGVFVLSIFQELIILIFTILKELLQLLKTLANSLFKLGDTK